MKKTIQQMQGQISFYWSSQPFSSRVKGIMLKCNSEEVNLLGPKVIQYWYVEFCRLLQTGYNLFLFEKSLYSAKL